jgi:hypothetical protein
MGGLAGLALFSDGAGEVFLCRGDAEVIDRVSGGRARLRVVS